MPPRARRAAAVAALLSAAAAAAAATTAPSAAPTPPTPPTTTPAIRCASDGECPTEFHSCEAGVCECKAGGGTDVVLDLLLPALVLLLMYGMGCAIYFDDLVRNLRNPRPLLVGITSQFGVMPLVAFSLGYIFQLSPAQHVGVIIIGCTPGGTTSNLFAYWANGDTSLSVAMTTASTTLAIGLQLGLIKLYADLPGGLVEQAGQSGTNLEIPYSKLLLVLMAVLVPVGAGVATLSWSYKYAQWGTRVGTWSGAIVVVIAIVYGGVTQSHIWGSSYKIWCVSILMGLCGFSFGYITSWVLRMPRRVSRTVALETGIQNGPLAIAIVQKSFEDPCLQSSLLVFPLFYSFWIVMESIGFALFLRHIPVGERKVVDRDAPQSVVLDAAGPEGGRPRRALCVGAAGDLVATDPARPGVRTLWDSFAAAADRFPKRRCLGRRSGNKGYKWETYQEVRRRAIALGSFLRSECGVGKGDSVGLYSINRPEWVVAEQACNAFGHCTVPLYDSLGAEAVSHILQQTQLRVVVCSLDRVERLLGELHEVKVIVCMDVPDQLPVSKAREAGVRLIDLRDAEAAGAAAPVSVDPPAPDDLAVLCYTSGTTGAPKGAMLTHANMVAMCSATGAVGISISQDDVHISYLPLAHVLERTVVTGVLGAGGAVGFFRGDVKLLMDDIVTLHPTIFCSVPRLLSRIHERILAKVDAQHGYACCVPSNCFPPPTTKRWMFHKGFEKKQRLLESSVVEEGFWDSSVFSNIQRSLGGRVRYIITGSAPIRAEVLDFMRIVFACDVHEGYGQTECAAACTITLPGDCSTGHVGPPMPTADVKLVSVPEMEYTVEDRPHPRGEVCVRGPTVFKGYYKDEERTRDAFPDGDEWLHTGDIGLWLPNGTLRIIDRRKNLFKLAQGEYVSPEAVEAVLTKSPLIAQAFVHGDSLQPNVVAVVVPDRVALLLWADGAGGLDVRGGGPTAPGALGASVGKWAMEGDERYAELCVRNEVQQKLLAEITTHAKEAKLRSFEVPKVLHVEPEEFSVDAGLLTPTFKLRRPDLAKHYAQQIANMYAKELGTAPAGEPVAATRSESNGRRTSSSKPQHPKPGFTTVKPADGNV